MDRYKVLVTGAKGFVGAEIVRQLVEKHEIVTIENKKKQSGEAVEKPSNAAAFSVDITDRQAMFELRRIGKCDAVVHAAGLAHQFGVTKRENFQNVNVGGTKNVLELALNLNVRHFVLISSVSVYGSAKNIRKHSASASTPVDETLECLPEDFYAMSKLDGENLARAFCRQNNIKLTILRLATVIGEGDKGNLLNLIRAVDRRRFIWIGNGGNYKSFVHKSDAAGACGAVLMKVAGDAEIEVFNVAADALRVREVVEIIGTGLKKKAPDVKIPAVFTDWLFSANKKIFKNRKLERLERTIGKWLAEDVYAAEKIRQIHGFKPQVRAALAVQREVEWYLAMK